MTEQRRHQRAAIDVPVSFAVKAGGERVAGRARDVSVGGMFIETGTPLPFSSELVVHVQLPGQRGPLALPAVVRWSGKGGMGVQFGLVGARETHALTELTRTATAT